MTRFARRSFLRDHGPASRATSHLRLSSLVACHCRCQFIVAYTVSQAQAIAELPPSLQELCKEGLHEEISKGVLRKKLAKMRHLIVKEAVRPEYLDTLMPLIIEVRGAMRINKPSPLRLGFARC